MPDYHKREMGIPERPKDGLLDKPDKEILPIPQDDDTVPSEEVPLTPSGVERILEKQNEPKKKDDRPN